jgi:sugar/nucleoside kinase (ribokinase family)
MDAALFGLIVADLIASPMDLRRPPPPGGLHVIDSLTLTTGGNVCNTGVAMAKLGMKVAAAGMVGKDVLGAAVLERLREAGLDTSTILQTDKAQTSATVVAVEPGGERCFFHTPGATPLLDAASFRACFGMFQRCAYVQVGYFGLLPTLTPHLPVVLQELKQHAPQTKVVLDTVNPPAAADLLWPILPHVDIFCPSRTEAAVLTGQKHPAQMVAAFRKHLPADSIVAIKLDAEGCYVDGGGKAFHAPAYKIDVVDTTGAGDTWCGAFMAGLIRGMDLEKSARFANRAAADCCTALGASAGVRSFEDTLVRAIPSTLA